MSETALFFVVLAGLYLLECATLLGKNALVLAAPWLGRFSAVRPSSLVGSNRVGLVLGNPVPPQGTAFIARAWPFSLAPQGLFGYSALNVHPDGRPPQSELWVPKAAVGTIGYDEKRLLVNGLELARGESPAQARSWSLVIDAWRKSGPGWEEESVRKALAASLDAAGIRRRADEFAAAVRPVRIAAGLLIVHLLGVAPGVVYAQGLFRTWLPLLAVMAVLEWTTAVLYWRAHAILYPDARGERLQFTVMLALVPMMAARATDYLARPLLAEAHPLAAAQALLEPEPFRAVARQVLLDARQPALPEVPANTDPAARAAEVWFRGCLREALEEFVKAKGLAPDELCAPPPPKDQSSHSWCPRCDTQYVLTDGVCENCGGIPLRPLAPSEPPAAA